MKRCLDWILVLLLSCACMSASFSIVRNVNEWQICGKWIGCRETLYHGIGDVSFQTIPFIQPVPPLRTAGRHGKDGRNSPEYYGEAGQDNEPQGKGYPPSGQEENVLVAEL